MKSPEEIRTDALWAASERTRIGPTHLCHDAGDTFIDRGRTRRCSCAIGRDHSMEEYWKWDSEWDAQWKGLWG